MLEAFFADSRSERKVVEFFVKVIEEVKVEDVYKILEEYNYIPDKPFKIGEGLTKGLNIVVASGKFKPVKPS